MGPVRGFRRLTLPAIVIVPYAALAALWLAGFHATYERILLVWGVSPYAFPFADIYGMLSSIACWAKGIDVYVVNPCDQLGRLFSYSPLPLWLAPTGIGPAATPFVGLAIDAVFIFSLALLPIPRAAHARRWMIYAALSPAVGLGLQRVNLDMVLFVAIVAAVRLLVGPMQERLGGFALITVTALAKFYPAVLFLFVLRERLRLAVAVAAVAAVVFAAFFAAYHIELMLTLANIPQGNWFQDMFGARNLPYGLAALGVDSAAAVLLVTMVVAAGAGALALGTARATEALARLTAVEATFLIAGAALVVGCFFAGQSFVYRSAYLILTLPGLVAMGRESATPRIRALFAVASAAVLFLMWEETLRQAATIAGPRVLFAFWLGRELVWWATMTLLAGIVVRFVRSSHLARAVPLWRTAPADSLRQSSAH